MNELSWEEWKLIKVGDSLETRCRGPGVREAAGGVDPVKGVLVYLGQV